MIQSQENCLFGNHRWTHERWEGDLYKSCVHLFPAIFIAGNFNGSVRTSYSIYPTSCSGRFSLFFLFLTLRRDNYQDQQRGNL